MDLFNQDGVEVIEWLLAYDDEHETARPKRPWYAGDGAVIACPSLDEQERS